MTDYLALAREAGEASRHVTFGSPLEATHLRLAQAYATIAIAEALTAHKPPQDVTAPPASRPAEPDLTLGESSIITLDRIEAQAEVVAAAQHVHALYDGSAIRQSGDWWHAVGTLVGAVDAMETADRLGGAS